MATIDLSNLIRISSSTSASGTAWTVFIAGESFASFTGDRARDRAIESALRRAEDLRVNGTVVIIVDPAHEGGKVTRVTRSSRLAS